MGPTFFKCFLFYIVSTELGRRRDLEVLFLGAGDPPAERPEEAVAVAGDRAAAPRRHVGGERADVAGTGRRRQRTVDGQPETGGLVALPVDARRVEDDRRAERRATDRPHRRRARRQLLRRRLMLLLLLQLFVVQVTVTTLRQPPSRQRIYARSIT